MDNIKLRNKKTLINKDIVFEYFRLIKNKDIEQLTDLFADDAIIYEPFSKLTEGLQGKSAIESFLRVSIMANDTLQHHIIIEKENQKNDMEKSCNSKIITALVTFERGDTMKARFTFELGSNGNNHVFDSKRKKIKALQIQFV
jgi:Nuclear transport factor 2 (NTF2) domain